MGAAAARAGRRDQPGRCHEQGYTSIGWEACTRLPAQSNRPRSGRGAGKNIQATPRRHGSEGQSGLEYLIGFVIAVFIALTGVGAGTITTPLLILFLGVPATTAVTTGLVFSAAVKLALVPAQVLRRQVDWRVLGSMLAGGLPGVLLGSLLLIRLAGSASRHVTNTLLGTVLVLTAFYQIGFLFRAKRSQPASKDRTRWLALLMFPVGAEVGFSSAGAGALGTAALLSLTALAPAQVVGTDILFGFVVSLVGGSAHLLSGALTTALLVHLVLGGLVGAAAGTWAARFIPRQPLRFALWLWLLALGLRLATLR